MNGDSQIESLVCDARTGTISHLVCASGQIPLAGSGCEFGDWHGFFSQDRRGGTNVTICEGEVAQSPSSIRGRFVVQLPRGLYAVSFADELVNRELVRDYILESMGEGLLGDFVLRAAASRDIFPIGEIGGRIYRHRGANYMRQIPVRVASLGGRSVSIVSELTAVEAPPQLGVYTYLRDQPNGNWIVHHRLLTEKEASDEYVLRLRHRVASSEQTPLLRSFRHILWRASERHSWIRPTIQMGGNIRTRRGECWRLKARIRVVPANQQEAG